MWLVTTNDNTPAQSLCLKLGWKLVATHSCALVHARTLKPAMPLTGRGGLPRLDELDFEAALSPSLNGAN